MSDFPSVVFDGKLPVSYGQAYVFAGGIGEWNADMADCFFQQNNGLCGTATPRIIWLVTGLHTGDVGITVEISEDTPTDEDDWEEVVEAPFCVDKAAAFEGVYLKDWDDSHVCHIPIQPGTYRVRYCARNMEDGREADILINEEPVDFYKLCFWPADLAPGKVIKQTSRVAAYWHNCAKEWTKREILSRQTAVWKKFVRSEFSGLSVENVIAKVLTSAPDRSFKTDEIIRSALRQDIEGREMKEACRQFRQPLIEGERTKMWLGRYIYSEKVYSCSADALAKKRSV